MTVRATYHPYTQPHINYQCPICLIDDTSRNPQTMVHTGQGDKHPIHKECIRNWAQMQPICPTCKTEIDSNSLYSWKERCVRELTNITKDALTGAISSAIGGALGVGVRTILGNQSMNGLPIPPGATEGSFAGVSFSLFKIFGSYKKLTIQQLVSKMIISSFEAKAIESTISLGVLVVGNPIATCAVIGAVTSVAFGILERH